MRDRGAQQKAKLVYRPADDVCKLITKGTTPPKSEISSSGVIPFLRVNNLTDGGRVGAKGEVIYVSRRAHEGFLARSRAFPGDILMNIVGPPLGKLLKLDDTFQEYNLNQAIVIFRPDTNVIDQDFLYYFVCSYVAQTWLEVRSKKTSGQQNLTIELCKELPVPDLPLPEQRKIAEILRTWDEALEKLTALRQLNIRRRVWFRTHLFTGKIRLPGFSGEWREVRLSDVLLEHGLSSTGAEEVYSVSVHKGLVNQVEHLGRSFSAANTDHYNRVLPGDIVYTKSPTGDFPLGIIKQSKIDRQVIVSPLYGIFTPQTYALGVILDALFESPLAARNYLHPLVQKGAKNTIAVTNSQFLEGKLRLPTDPAEQAAIADIVNASHAECASLEAKIEALTLQKRGLMQRLLTGEWRVTLASTEGVAQATMNLKQQFA